LLKSMTGYAKVEKFSEKFRVSCEVKSLNSKGLDINVSLPYYLSSKEIEITKIISSFLTRGKVNVRINVKFLTPVNLSIDYVMAKSYYDTLEGVRESLGIQNSIVLGDLLNFREIFRGDIEDEVVEELWNFTKEVLSSSLEMLVEERKKEGQKICKDIENMVNKIEEITLNIEKVASDMKEEIAKKLRESVEEILPENVEMDTNQFETAVALIADKADIREEIERLKSHIDRMKELLLKDEPVGMLFNFLTQEVHREFNTILSKSRMLEISNLALEGKYINSQLKEQIQNVE